MAALFAALVAGIVYSVTAPRRALRAYRAELVARGETLDLLSLIPQATPDGLAAAARFQQAASALLAAGNMHPLAPRMMRRVAPGKAEIGWARTNIVGDQKPVSWQESAATLEPGRSALEKLAVVLQAPRLDWNLDYLAGQTMQIPHLAGQKGAAQWLAADAMHALHNRRTDAAISRIQSMLRLARLTQDDGLLICQLVRIAVTAITVSATWEVLQAEDLPEPTLAELQRHWTTNEFIRAMTTALERERALSLETFRRLRQDPGEMQRMMAPFGGPGMAAPPPANAASGADFTEMVATYTSRAATGTATSAFWTTWSRFWSYSDELFYLRSLQQNLEAARRCAQSGYGPAQVRADPDPFGLTSVRRFLSGMLLPGTSRALLKAVRCQTERDQVVTTIAIRRFQLRHGRLPASLEELVPPFLPETPRDWMDGRPLRYRVEADGRWLLYGIGEDGVDDGGDGSPAKGREATSYAQTRDWVWPQPATPEEIAAHDAKLSKRAPSVALRPDAQPASSPTPTTNPPPAGS